VIVFGALAVPLGVLEKLSDDGDTVSFGEVCASKGSGCIHTIKPRIRINAFTVTRSLLST
jgi:hypothetical protein